MDAAVILPRNFIQQDAWRPLKKFTNARIAVGRTGHAIPLAENLQFRADHARARDAVYTALDAATLAVGLSAFGLPVLTLKSKATTRQEYLQRPDWGRQLHETSREILAAEQQHPVDIAIIIADGLSANAVALHACPVLQELFYLWKGGSYTIAPLCIVQQARVAISDETGSLLNSRLSIILIGERPGLSSPHSMGIYITYKPAIGNTDESRNCISNIHPLGGLTYKEAALQAFSLVQDAFALQLSGVHLKSHKILEH
jgi:ethanolamine ammonia-lyase small subunit